MDIEESLGEDFDHFVFDCGDDELDLHQKQYYLTKEKDISELINTVRSCQSALAGRQNAETLPNPSPDAGGKPCNMTNSSSLKPAGTSTQPVVVQATNGVGNSSPGFMILDPTSLRLVSSSNNVKLYSVAPTTAVAKGSSSVSSISSPQTPLGPRIRHTLPQQLPPWCRTAIRTEKSNTQVVNSSPPIKVSCGTQVNIPSLSVKTSSACPLQIKVLGPAKPGPARYKIVARPTYQCPSFPVVSQSTSAQHYIPIIAPKSITASQSMPTTVVQASPQYVPAPSGEAYIRISQPLSNVNSIRPVSTNLVKNMTTVNSSTPAVMSSLPLLPVTRTSPPPLVNRPNSNLVDLLEQAKNSLSADPEQPRTPHNPTVTQQRSKILKPPPGRFGRHPEVLRDPKTKVSPTTLPTNSSTSTAVDQLVDLTAEDNNQRVQNQPSNIVKPPSGKLGTHTDVSKDPKTKVSPTALPPNSSSSTAMDQLVDLTAEDNSQGVQNITASENISSCQNLSPKKNFLKEKTFPSLVVTARACMKPIPSSVAASRRVFLDNQLRKILQMPPQMFTEYLLQQRLLRSEQQCKSHGHNLKLGMYSDSARFPHSGGYVWISECCNSGFCSVFSGSIFDKTLQPPTTILKLMYHWSCNTAVHNVLQWVKVDNFIVKTYYTFFRAICTAAVQEKTGMLGGAFKKVQVGIISLGTSDKQGKKDVKIDILAAMDAVSMQLRLRALDTSAFCNVDNLHEKKLQLILGVLEEWVHPSSTIITDFAIDLPRCKQFGFGSVVVSGGKGSATNNLEVMGYLKNWVPKMFQNTLNLLSIQIIQQFLDELVWREQWGPIPSRAYDNLISHISEITKLPGPDIISKLKKIASYPNKNWKYDVWKNSTSSNLVDKSSANIDVSPQKSQVPMAAPSVPMEQKLKEPLLDSSSKLKQTLLSYKGPPTKSQKPKDDEVDVEKTAPTQNNSVPSIVVNENTFDIDDIVPLESYYYGSVDGIPQRQKYTGAFLAECALCKRDFLTASSFTDHLIHHALNGCAAVSKESTDLMSVCKICLQAVKDVSSHVAKTHSKRMSSLPNACKICNVDHKSDERLYRHMANVHCELDMPYSCEECRFRTSIYDDAATHFEHLHNKDTCVQCPFCLKVVRLCTLDGREIKSNQHYFVQHVQKHNISKLNRNCEKCMLSFSNMGILKWHQENFHSTGKNLLHAVRYNENPASFIRIKRPEAKPLPPVTLHESSFHTLKGKVLASIFQVDPSLCNSTCVECDGPIAHNHFSVKMTCTRCRFQSHCANAIKEHSARTHLALDVVSNIPQVIGGSPLQKKPLHCSKCTFSTYNGNLMAAHLADCVKSAVATTEKRTLSPLNGNEISEFSKKRRKNVQ